MVKLLSESISGASNRFVVSKNMGIEYGTQMSWLQLNSASDFKFSLKKSRGQKWAWPK